MFFFNYIPRNIIPNILNGKEKELVIIEIANDKVFENSETEIERYKSMEVLTYPQENEDGCIFILDELKKKEVKDARI